MKDQDTPMTKGDLQTILSHITRERRNVENYVDERLGEVETRLENIENDLENIENDVNVIADVLKLERDEKGQLKKTA